MERKMTYWVRSRQNNEQTSFGRMPVPAQFETLKDAELYQRKLNLRRGAFHPGYFVEELDETSPPPANGFRK